MIEEKLYPKLQDWILCLVKCQSQEACDEVASAGSNGNEGNYSITMGTTASLAAGKSVRHRKSDSES